MLNALEINGYKLTKFEDEEEPRMPSGEIASRIGMEPKVLKDRIRKYMAAGELKNTRVENFLGVSGRENAKQGGLSVFKTLNPLGGRPEVEFFLCEHDTLFVIVKSRTPIANQITHEVIDVFISARKGMLPIHPAVAANQMASILKDVVQDIKDIRKEISYIKDRPPLNINLPSEKALPLVVGRKIPHRSWFGIIRQPEARRLAVEMLTAGRIYKDVTEELNKIPGFVTSKSAVARFWQAAREGRLKEFGIDVVSVTVN